MSVSSHRLWPFRPTDVLVATAIFVSAACHQAQSPAPEPTVVEEPRSTSPRDARSRRFPAVDIVPTAHSGFQIRILSAVVGDGEPLYVIDGVRIRIPANRGIDWFKPEDIVEIKVLKFPHELAEYGADGVNGVIVVTTKQALTRRNPR